MKTKHLGFDGLILAAVFGRLVACESTPSSQGPYRFYNYYTGETDPLLSGTKWHKVRRSPQYGIEVRYVWFMEGGEVKWHVLIINLFSVGQIMPIGSALEIMWFLRQLMDLVNGLVRQPLK
jgi:hypothetical protein